MSDEATLFATYRQHWAARWGMPSSLLLSVIDFGKLGLHRQTLTDAQLEEALAGYFETEDSFVVARRHPLGLFLREPMRWMPVRQTVQSGSFCSHVPRCETFTVCRDRTLAEGREGRV